MQSMHLPDLAIFLPSFARGGAERTTLTLANGIAARGFAVDLIVASAQGAFRQDVAPSIRVIDFQTVRVSKSFWPLRHYLKQNCPKAMLSIMTHTNLVAILARRWTGVSTRLVISERTSISQAAHHCQSLQEHLIYTLVPWFYPEANAIVAVSEGVARDLEAFARLPQGTVQTIYNPFNLDHIKQLATEQVTHPWFAAGEPPVILATGRLEPEKDFSTLIHAFAKVRAQRQARLVILGDGSLRSELLVLAHQLGLTNDEIDLPGFVANPYAYMAKSKVFVLSSRFEGLPGVLVEAMACGVPVVSTNCAGGSSEILQGGHWGQLVPVGDAEALSQAILRVLSTPIDSLPKVHQRAQEFEQERAIDAYLKVLGLALHA